MKRILIFDVFFAFFISYAFTEELDSKIIELLDFDIYVEEKKPLKTQLPDGAVYELLDISLCDRAVRLFLYSSLGRTEYTCLRIKDSKVWYLKKRAVFYNEPYNNNGAEEMLSYFKYKDQCYKLVNNEFIENINISSSPAVVDFRNIQSIVELIEEDIYNQTIED